MKNIQKSNSDTYYIYRTINGKTAYFGAYKTKKEAIQHYNCFDKEGWNREKLIEKGLLNVNSNNSMRHIHQRGENYFIDKLIDGKMKYFGSFETIEEAIKFRDEAEACNWNIVPVRKRAKYEKSTKYNLPKHVYYNKRCKRYDVKKYDLKSKKLVLYGSYNDLEDAIIDKKLFELCSWDWENICNNEVKV